LPKGLYPNPLDTCFKFHLLDSTGKYGIERTGLPTLHLKEQQKKVDKEKQHESNMIPKERGPPTFTLTAPFLGIEILEGIIHTEDLTSVSIKKESMCMCICMHRPSNVR
jgi:hypothetical protein